MRLCKITFFLVYVPFFLCAQSGIIKGIVLDQATQQPLEGVNVIVEGLDLGTASDTNGRFIINDVPDGFYHVSFVMMGYRKLAKLNVRVTGDRSGFIKAELEQDFIIVQDVSVTRAYFQKEKDAVVSSRTVDYAEIIRDPGGAIDIQRMMQALPAVVSAADQMNEIVVRGGSPGENLFVMDNIEISNPNHFGEQSTGGGPINLINTTFVDRVDFFAGAFPAKYYDRASSVMDIRLREGDRDRHSMDMDMSMAGLGLSGEGPTFGGRGSYLISFRKSYLDLIIRQTGLVAIPRYWNTQMKFTYDINPVNKLMFNITHGVDAIDIEGENDASSRGAENVVSRGNQTIFGVTYKRLWKNEGITRFTFGGTRARFKYDVYRYLADGEKDQYYRQDELEWDLQFKTDFVWRLSRHLEISAGMDLKEIGRDFDAYADADTLWQYGYLYPGSSDSYQIVDQSTWFTEIYPIVSSAEGDSVYLDSQDVWHYSATDPQGNWQSVLVQKLDTVRVDEDWSTLKKDSFPRIGAFAQVKWHPMIQLTITAGLRYGYFQITDFSWLSPRLGLSYHFSDKTSLNAGYGHHYQSPSVLLLSYDPVNESLKNKDSEQLVLGLEHFFAKDTRGTLEIYRKRTRNKPIPLSATTVDSSDYSTEFVNKGENQSSGVELFLQKKLARDLFGTFSYSYYRSEDRDPRYPDQDLYYPAAFDYKNVLTLIGGYKLQMKGNNTRPLSERNPMIRFVGKYVGLGADELELSFRYRYVGGKPYTPLSYDHNTRRWFESQGGDRNTHRFAEYHRLDIMILWHSQIFGKNLISYIDIMNIFNRPNIWDLQRNPDGTVDDILQFQTFPVGGFILEF